MSKENEKVVASREEKSRRGLFETALLVVGGAAATVAVAGSALARPSEIVMDASGRVVLNDALTAGQKGQSSRLLVSPGSFEIAARKTAKDNGACGAGCKSPVVKPAVKGKSPPKEKGKGK
jgi:hypothetical protein